MTVTVAEKKERALGKRAGMQSSVPHRRPPATADGLIGESPEEKEAADWVNAELLSF